MPLDFARHGAYVGCLEGVGNGQAMSWLARSECLEKKKKTRGGMAKRMGRGESKPTHKPAHHHKAASVPRLRRGFQQVVQRAHG